ncbi:LLM class flavin-dependent oxidoreductase [Amycolatopsis sp. NPDC005232]|uniref:LLM class flavin-dependent oxidoreductase n=1 Tax=Amycolatopsis sp. NPDC005232 TaxID=3157027 RepID=UPI0033BA69AB
MARLGLAYDLRLPGLTPEQRARQYRTCLEQVEWADRVGIGQVALREHHGSDDGYLPSPLVLGGAVAARTSSLTIHLQALVVTLHDPVRLAEDLAVLDLISGGRLVVTVGAGYDPNEHAMFGRSFDQRPADVERAFTTLRKAWTGEKFELDGRPVRVTPQPYQDPGPALLLGGASAAAARRAARIADGFLPVRDRFYAAYRSAVVELGQPDPGPLAKAGPLFVYVAEDPDRAWQEIGPYCLHESNAYAALARASGLRTGFTAYPDIDALRSSGQYPIYTPDELVALCRQWGDESRVTIPPLAGGMPPELSWRSLELIADRVVPRITARPSPPASFRTSSPTGVIA